jgi:hypothetical protein
MTRVAPRALDDDNNVSAFKGIRDQIAEQLGLNDRDQRIAWRYEQERGPACVRIELALWEPRRVVEEAPF